jgi:hypothetical protein
MDLILNWKLDFAILAVLDFSIISLIVGSTVDCSAPVFKWIDFTFHIIVGVLVICASSLLLDAVFKWELNEYSSKGIYRTNREAFNYGEQVAAGAIGTFDGILYLVNLAVIVAQR